MLNPDKLLAHLDPTRRRTVQQLLEYLQQLPEKALAAELELIELKSGETLFAHGQEGDMLYLLLAGTLSVSIRQRDGSELEIDHLLPGAFVGEQSFLTRRPRSTTVYARDDSRVMQLTRTLYDKLVAQEPLVDSLVSAHFDTSWKRTQLAFVLKDLLGDIDAADLGILQKEVAWLQLTNGDILFREGDAPDGMYIVINGRLRVVTGALDAQPRFVAEITPGRTVGEYGLISDEPRSATVLATRETNVVRVAPETFERLVRQYPAFMKQLAKIIVEGARTMLVQGPTPAPTSLTVTLLPATQRVDIQAFGRLLAASLQRFGTVAVLDSAGFDRQIGRDGAAQTEPGTPLHAASVGWFNELETDIKYVIFLADRDYSPWTRRCIGHSDRLLLVAEPMDDPAPGGVERQLMEMETPIRQELVLLHPADAPRPKGTAAWLAERSVHAHHHLRKDDGLHMDRLARRLSGNGIALVLSGGAARGFAHIGVHRAMEELNIPIDYIGGTSMGAVTGAIIAVHQVNQQIMELAKQFADPRYTVDRTLPLTSLMKSEKVTKIAQELYGDVRIEDLWVPFFCVVANLTKAQAVPVQHGPLWRAVRASGSIPGVYAPVIEDGQVLVDGGVINNFPTDIMAQLCDGEYIIGVNVVPFRERVRDYDIDTYVSGWEILRKRINPFAKPVKAPSILETMMRSLDVNNVHRARETGQIVDLLIAPEARGIGTLEFHRYPEAIEKGYETAYKPLRQWKETRLSAIYH